MTTHAAKEDKRVLVHRGKAVVHEDQEYLIISIPTTPKKKRVAAAKA